MPFCQIIEEVELLYFQIVWKNVGYEVPPLQVREGVEAQEEL